MATIKIYLNYKPIRSYLRISNLFPPRFHQHKKHHHKDASEQKQNAMIAPAHLRQIDRGWIYPRMALSENPVISVMVGWMYNNTKDVKTAIDNTLRVSAPLR